MIIWDALAPLEIKRGTSTPLLLKCECQSGEERGAHDNFIVKMVTSPGMSPQMLYREGLGAALARFLGAPSVEPALVEISPQFIAVAQKTPFVKAAGLRFVPGLAFGTRDFGGGYREVDLTQLWDVSTSEEAAAIYIVDMLLQNGDRKEIRPNCAQRGPRLMAYDYGLTLSRLDVPAVRINSLGAGPRHLFFNKLRGRTNNFADFEHRLASLSEGILSDMIKTFPQTWRAEEVDIFNFLLEAADNAAAFVRVVKESLQ